MLAIIFFFALSSCSKTDYAIEHIKLVKAELDKNGYNYKDIVIEEDETNDYYIDGKLMSANRKLIIVVDFNDNIENHYSDICGIIECVKDLRVSNRNQFSNNPYHFYTHVRCEDFTYMLLNYSLVRTDEISISLYNTITAKKGVGLTYDEKQFIFEEIEKIFIDGSFDAILNGDDNFETRTYQEISKKYNITVPDLKKYMTRDIIINTN